jgi:cell division control protein 6
MTSSSGGSGIDESIFNAEHIIFQNKDLLKTGHVPDADRIIGRDEEINKLGTKLNDAVRGLSPEDIVIYGKTGSGKSLVVKHVTHGAVQASDPNVELGRAYIDCNEDSTETQAVRELVESLNDESITGINVPYTGLATSQYYKYLWDVLDKLYDSVIIILDEIDLMDDDKILMALSRAEESGKTDCSIGVIAISNKISYVDSLNERTKSSFQHQDILFKPYDADQLGSIMENRRDAFQDGVLTDDVIPLTSALAAQEHGDARKAIDILRHAGEVARENESDQVTEEHVRQAQTHAEKDRFRELIRTSPQQAKVILHAIATLSVSSEKESFSTKKVYRRYEELCKEYDHDILSNRRFREILKEHTFLGVVETQRTSDGPDSGVYLQTRLVQQPEVVKDTTKDVLRLNASDS